MSVLLGRPDDVITWAPDEYLTRVGGPPTFPASCGPPSDKLTRCSVCGNQLALLLQAHAPLTAAQTGSRAQQERFLYLLGCVREGCGTKAGSWRALRCQPPTSSSSSIPGGTADSGNRPSSSVIAPTTPAGDVFGGAAADDWGVGNSDEDWGAGSSDWAAAESATVSGSTADCFDFGDLNAALDALGSKPGAKQQQPPPQQQQPPPPPQQPPPQQQQPDSMDAVPCPPAEALEPVGLNIAPEGRLPVLPGFVLRAEEEGAQAQRGSARRQQQQEEEARLQQLLQRYQREEQGLAPGAERAAAAGASSAAGTAAAASGVCLPQAEDGPESWAGEGYEADAVLQADRRRGSDVAQLKFFKRLGRCPDQCARYSFGGELLWPAREAPAAEACARCGGQRVFELQLMTPAIPYLEESADWLEQQQHHQQACKLPRPPASWDWLTVAVLSCGTSCSVAGGGWYAEEQVLLFGEGLAGIGHAAQPAGM